MGNIINIFTDGGSRGNPGPGAYGVSIEKEGHEIAGFGKNLGICTNNYAEYMGVIQAYEYLLSNRETLGEISGINFFMDSLLVASQLKGAYKVKNLKMKELFMIAKSLEKELGRPVSYTHIPREKNKRADSFVNKALDNLS